MSLIELLIVIAILAGFVLLAAPTAGKFIRRSQNLAAYSSVQQVLATARLQAVKRGANVVVLVSVTPENKIRLFTFQDRANDEESPLPADEAAAAANFQQDSGFLKGAAFSEPTLGEVILPSNVVVWKQGGTLHDTGAGIGFDAYQGNSALSNRIGFLPSGGIAPPEDGVTSGLPTPTGGRGIYFADVHGKNYFRVTVDSDLSGRLRVDKYRPGAGYQSSGWAWY
jgi:type II secretory pathway pseudopilin PulG